MLNEKTSYVVQVPQYETFEFRPRQTKYCLCIPVLNEGDRIKSQLKKLMDLTGAADIIIADGGSIDDSMDAGFLKSCRVRTLLIKRGPGRLGAQLRMGYYYALLKEGYEGIITVDGNDKDDVSAIPDFIGKLESGYDFVQGSRFVPGGAAINTPLNRLIAIKLIHAPVVSCLAGFHYTDTTNGFRGYSRKLLLDRNIGIFRDIFSTYELLAYLSVKAPRLGYKTIEIPVTRKYPKSAKAPTKISPLAGYFGILKILGNLILKKYDIPKG
jgi:dolichol-phosphate mannosyltransferase